MRPSRSTVASHPVNSHTHTCALSGPPAVVLVLALLPFPLHSAGFPGEVVWGWSSGIGAVLLAATYAAGPAALRRDERGKRAVGERQDRAHRSPSLPRLDVRR